ncbi:NAD(P)-dependent dehydrogenase, short-chain alcohol dehydrogenase family [Micromonospora inositola]|uniref:NAD(P)-dependent dehydrogenase, short-chain alcohol dehydrogenase family n=1 Tax=Micromonospora inositola TaxID=47865 RepID=A0A1C5K5E6_9ACTN|nr:NAD(P)-dependent dehydrogenase, short-chain alcohol dehydrogenase family [Micromonospora inositola]
MNDTGQRSAIVTGGGAGIGAAVVASLLERGYAVTAIDLHFDRKHDDPRFLPVEADARDEGRCRELVSSTPDLRLLVNCAAIRPEAPVLDQTVEGFRAAVDVNLTAAFVLLQAAASAMDAGGSIVNVCSAAAYGKRHLAAYGASKAGLVTLTKVAALELAEHGIRVNAVLPGTTDTPMLQQVRRPSSSGGRSPRNVTQLVLKPAEVASSVVRVAEDPMLSGAVVPVGLLPYEW